MFGLGVLADHHWSVYMPLPVTRQKKTILFVCLPWHPSLLRCGCLFSPYPLWHASSGSKSALFPVESRTLREIEGINLLVHTCRSNSLPFFFPSLLIFSISYLFSFYFFFLILVFYLLVFKFLIPWCLCCPLYMARAFFLIMSAVIGFYYFSP